MPANFDGSTQQRRALVSYQHSTNHQLLPRASLTVFHSSVIPRFITRLRSVVKIVDLRWHVSDHGKLFCLLYLLADNKTRLIQSPEVKLSLVVGKDIQQAEEFPMNAPGRGDNSGEEGATHILGRVARPIFVNLLLWPLGEHEVDVLIMSA